MINIPKLFNIKLQFHWSCLLFFLMLYFFVDFYFFLSVIALFGFVILHEYGHCLMAINLGLEVKDIIIFPFGGVAQIKIGICPKKEFWVALAGPFVNLVLFLIFINSNNNFLEICAYLNLVILVFNLFVPILPMDGGRIIRDIIYFLTKNYLLSTLITVRFGQVLAVILSIIAIYYDNFLLAFTFFIMIHFAQLELTNTKILVTYQNIKEKIAEELNEPEVLDYTNEQIMAKLKGIEDVELRKKLCADELLFVLAELDN